MGFTLQPTARRDLVDVAVDVDLQQRARMIGWTSGRFWNHTVKAQRPEIQLIDKHVDHPHRVVLSNVVIQILGKQNALYTVFTLNEARHLTTPARIIQNYNSTGVFTQPRWEAVIRSSRMRCPVDAAWRCRGTTRDGPAAFPMRGRRAVRAGRLRRGRQRRGDHGPLRLDVSRRIFRAVCFPRSSAGIRRRPSNASVYWGPPSYIEEDFGAGLSASINPSFRKPSR